MSNTVTVELTGPKYLQSAIELSQEVAVKSISQIRVYRGLGTAELSTLTPALRYLRNFLAHGAQVALVLSSVNIPPSFLSDLSTAAGVPVEFAAMPVDAQQEREPWKILPDIQLDILKIWGEITVDRARSADRESQKWNKLIHS